MHTTSRLVQPPTRRRFPGPLVLLIWLLMTAVAAVYMYAITPQVMLVVCTWDPFRSQQVQQLECAEHSHQV